MQRHWRLPVFYDALQVPEGRGVQGRVFHRVDKIHAGYFLISKSDKDKRYFHQRGIKCYKDQNFPFDSMRNEKM